MKTSVLLQEMSPDELRAMIQEEILKAKDILVPDPLLSRSQVAALIGKSIKTVERMEAKGIIRSILVCGQPRYSKSEILKR